MRTGRDRQTPGGTVGVTAMCESEEALTCSNLYQSHQCHQPLRPHPILNVPKPRPSRVGPEGISLRQGSFPLSAPIWAVTLGAQGKRPSGPVFQPSWQAAGKSKGPRQGPDPQWAPVAMTGLGLRLVLQGLPITVAQGAGDKRRTAVKAAGAAASQRPQAVVREGLEAGKGMGMGLRTQAPWSRPCPPCQPHASWPRRPSPVAMPR